jgi:hypothetical protein
MGKNKNYHNNNNYYNNKNNNKERRKDFQGQAVLSISQIAFPVGAQEYR